MTDAIDMHLQRHHKELLGKQEENESIEKRLADVRSSEKVASDVAGLRVESTAGALAKYIGDSGWNSLCRVPCEGRTAIHLR
jgi:hypothetical protein